MHDVCNEISHPCSAVVVSVLFSSSSFSHFHLLQLGCRHKFWIAVLAILSIGTSLLSASSMTYVAPPESSGGGGGSYYI